jgi:hypothetical protein
VEGTFECGDEPSASIKGGEFLNYLTTGLASHEEFCSMELVKAQKGLFSAHSSMPTITSAPKPSVHAESRT